MSQEIVLFAVLCHTYSTDKDLLLVNVNVGLDKQYLPFNLTLALDLQTSSEGVDKNTMELPLGFMICE